MVGAINKMTEPLSGMERMMQSLMRAAGFDPKIVMDQMGAVITQITSGLQKVASTLDGLLAESKKTNERLALIERDLQILKAASGITDEPKQLEQRPTQ